MWLYCICVAKSGTHNKVKLAKIGDIIMTQLTFRTPSIMGRAAFEQIMDQWFKDPFPMIKQSTSGYPITDIYKEEGSENQIIEMALAGFKKEDIKIKVVENKITISYDGQPSQAPGQKPRRIAKRSFSKTFVDYYNELDLPIAVASFENGLLRIVIPANSLNSPIDIKIK